MKLIMSDDEELGLTGFDEYEVKDFKRFSKMKNKEATPTFVFDSVAEFKYRNIIAVARLLKKMHEKYNFDDVYILLSSQKPICFAYSIGKNKHQRIYIAPLLRITEVNK